LTTPATHITSANFVTVDASVWVSYISTYDVNHTRAQNWISQHLANGGLLTSPLLLVVETASAIARVTQNLVAARHAISQLYSFPRIRLIPLDLALIDDAADIAVSFGLRGSDSFYVAVARQLNIPLVSFDHEQLSRPASILATIRP
jgi:predicted nucleic acid-binding protein